MVIEVYRKFLLNRTLKAMGEAKKNKKEKAGNAKKEQIRGSDAEEDRGINKGEFAHIGAEQAGQEHTEEEIKGSDADQ